MIRLNIKYLIWNNYQLIMIMLECPSDSLLYDSPVIPFQIIETCYDAKYPY